MFTLELDDNQKIVLFELLQAVVQIEDANAEPGQIVQVIQAGYVIKDRLLRPAMVAVAKTPASANPEEPKST